MMTLKLTFDDLERSWWHIVHEKTCFQTLNAIFSKSYQTVLRFWFQKMLTMVVGAAYQYVCPWIAASIFGKFLKFRKTLIRRNAYPLTWACLNLTYRVLTEIKRIPTFTPFIPVHSPVTYWAHWAIFFFADSAFFYYGRISETVHRRVKRTLFSPIDS